jgi:hypothetical protein
MMKTEEEEKKKKKKKKKKKVHCSRNELLAMHISLHE